MTSLEPDYFERMMGVAIAQAELAAERGEVPVGCVVARAGEVVAAAGNAPISQRDPTGHAEIRTLRDAGNQLDNYRLPGCDLFVTLEPCVMCAGAMIHARIDRVIYGATDPKTGAAGTVFDILGSSQHNHRVEIVAGVMASQCSEQLASFFKLRRQQARRPASPSQA